MNNINILNKSQQGFTLIELVIVIVILGILAAVALPKFVDLKDDARTAALKGVAGAISSGSTTNYAAKMAGKSTAITVDQANVCTNAIMGSLLTGGMPTGISVDTAYGSSCTSPTEYATCVITDGATPSGLSAVRVICAR